MLSPAELRAMRSGKQNTAVEESASVGDEDDEEEEKRLQVWEETPANRALLQAARELHRAQLTALKIGHKNARTKITIDTVTGKIMAPMSGRIGSTFGQPVPGDSSHIQLLPEEAYFLHDIGLATVWTTAGVELSGEEAMHFLLAQLPLHRFLVFAQLARLGYRITAHTEKEIPSQASGHSETTTRPKDGKGDAMESWLQRRMKPNSVQDKPKQVVDEIVSSVKPESVGLNQVKVEFPNDKGSPSLCLSEPSASQVPLNAGHNKDFIDRRNLTQKPGHTETWFRRPKRSWEFYRQPSRRIPPPLILAAPSWAAFRDLKQRWLHAPAPDRGHLYTEVQPLVDPDGGDQSQEELFAQLRIIPRSRRLGTPLPLFYDLFLPDDVTFTIAYHPRPAYSLAVIAGDEARPTIDAITATLGALRAPARLLLAVVDGAEISFLHFSA